MPLNKDQIKRIVHAIEGSLFILLGIFVLLVAYVGLEESDSTMSVVIIAAVGIALIVAGVRALRDVRAPQISAGSRSYSSVDATGLEAPSTLADLPTSSSAAAVGAASGNTERQSGSTRPTSSIFSEINAPKNNAGDDAILTLIGRSNNLLATLKDIVRHASHESANYSAPDYLLVSMLSKSGLMSWEDHPILSPFVLRRTEHHWLGSTEELEDPEHINTLLAVECALALDVDLRKQLGKGAARISVDEARQKARGILSSIMKLQAKPTRTPTLYELTYPNMTNSERPQEWLLREELASYAENIALPARVNIDLQANLAEKIALLTLHVPGPEVFVILDNETDGDGLAFGASDLAPVANAGAADTNDAQLTYPWSSTAALEYAIRCAFMFGDKVFSTTPEVDELIVNCAPHRTDECLLSLKLSRDNFATVIKSVQSSSFDGESFMAQADSSWLKASRLANGWLVPTDPFMKSGDERVDPAWRYEFPELSNRLCSKPMQEFCHVKHISDLGYNEHAALLDAWKTLEPQLTGSTSDKVSAIVSLRDSSNNLSIIDACERCSKLLVESEEEIGSEDLLDSFLYGSALIRAERKADALLHEEIPQVEEALLVLNQVLDPIDSIGMYLDDSDTVYRYFGSLGERLRYNQSSLDDGRKVTLVPDAYYNCHSIASQCLTLLERSEEAMQHADVCSRIGPLSVDAVMRKLRILENDSRIFEAEELIRSWIPKGSIPRDVALCHYRLAYMEWKLGRNDLAIACYRRALEWHTPITDQAKIELEDLAQTIGVEKIPTFEEAKKTLTQANIPLGFDDETAQSIAKMAVLCVDEGLFMLARHYVSICIDVENGDDELFNIYRWI